MASMVIHGGKRLEGVVKAQGSKTSAMCILLASLLSSGPVILKRVPDIWDVDNTLALVRSVGADVEHTNHTVVVTSHRQLNPVVDGQLGSSIRHSLLLLGVLLSRTGSVVLPYPGGCNIGYRRFDMHVDALKSMGAGIEYRTDCIVGSVDRLHSADIKFYYPSVAATMHVVAASVLTDGITTLHNAAIDPEVVDYLMFLQGLGASIHGVGTRTLEIEGVEALGAGEYELMSDRMVMTTYLIMGAVTNGRVTVTEVSTNGTCVEIKELEKAGVSITFDGDTVTASVDDALSPLCVSTAAYPGFTTDLHPPMVALLATTSGRSVVSENIMDGRFKYVNQLIKMSANVEVVESSLLCVNDKPAHDVIVNGVAKLSGCRVRAADLRGGAALVVAALGASGTTTVEDVHHMYRGYESVVENLRLLGADVELVDDK